MIKKWFALLIVMMIPVFLFGESYSSLWKKVENAYEKDLPKSEYELLEKIVAKAEKDRDYGQLLTAKLRGVNVMSRIAPDSLQPAIVRLQKRCEDTSDEVLRTVLQTVLYQVSSENSNLGITIEAPELTPSLCEKLATVRDAEYSPFVVEGINSSIFNNDLLHVIGYELDMSSSYRAMHDYYDKVGNRRAACVTAAKVYHYASREMLDSVIRVYEDLPEAGELALERYRDIGYDKKERSSLISKRHSASGATDGHE